MSTFERDTGRATTVVEGAPPPVAEVSSERPGTRFSTQGTVPPVASGDLAHGPSASERAFGDGPQAALPREVALDGVSASVEIPAQRRLAGNWTYRAETREANRVGVSIGHRGIHIWMSPGIHLDVTWPGRDCVIQGVSMAFGAAPRADVRDGGGVGLVPVTGIVSSQITHMLQQVVGGTRLADPHYDPLRDPDLAGTAQQIAQGFAHLFGGSGGESQRATPGGLALDDVTARSAGADLTIAEPIRVGSNIEIAAGAHVHLEAHGAANVGHVAAGQDNGDRIRPLHFDALVLTSPGIDIRIDGKEVVRLQQLAFLRGGEVSVQRMTSLGTLGTARAVESTLAGIAALLLAVSGDEKAAAFADHAVSPNIVDGVAARTIERKLEAALRGLIMSHDDAIPGVSLAAALGLR